MTRRTTKAAEARKVLQFRSPGHPLEGAEPMQVVTFLQDEDQGPRRHLTASRHRMQRAFIEAYTVIVAVRRCPDRQVFEDRLRSAAADLGYPSPTSVKALLALAFGYLAETEGIVDQPLIAKARRAALSRLSRDAAAVDYLLAESISPKSAGRLIQQQGEGLDAWARRGAAPTPGASTQQRRPGIVAAPLADFNACKGLRLAFCKVEPRAKNAVATEVLVVTEALESRKVKKAAKAYRKAVKDALRERVLTSEVPRDLKRRRSGGGQ